MHGWNINLKAAYGSLWKDKEKFHLREDLYESPDKNLAVLLYGIAEIGVSKDVGRLAIFRDKKKPELVLNLPRLGCWYLHDSAVQFGKNGLLFIHRFKSFLNRFTIQLCVLDPERRRFAFIEPLAENFYSVRQDAGTKYAFEKMGSGPEAAKTLLELNDLKWRPLNQRTGGAYGEMIRDLLRAMKI